MMTLHNSTDENSKSLVWRLRTQSLVCDRPLIMGIVNTTPDSFSDGGLFFESDQAIEHALRLVDQGADIVDIGGESTRPYSDPVSEAEEWTRVAQVVEAVCQQVKVPVSIDTTKAAIAQKAIEFGAEIVNDVSGLQSDPKMVNTVADSGVGVCVMHTQGTPQTMQDNPQYANVVEEIFDYLQARKENLIDNGIDANRICLDPGIGFGKTHEHNLELLTSCRRFLDLQSPILIGHSRKGFIGKLIGNKESDRTAGTIGVSLALALQGMHILRVHDVQETRDAIDSFFAALPTGPQTSELLRSSQYHT